MVSEEGSIEGDQQRHLEGGRPNSRSTTVLADRAQSGSQRHLAGGRCNVESTQAVKPASSSGSDWFGDDMDVKRVVVVYEPWMNDKNNQQQEVLDRIRDLTLRDSTEIVAGNMVTPPTITLSTAADEPHQGCQTKAMSNGPKDAGRPNGGLLGVPKIDLAKERRPPMQATFT